MLESLVGPTLMRMLTWTAMPKLLQYKERDNGYVLTSINQTIITFQLTPRGERKLRGAGVLIKGGSGAGISAAMFAFLGFPVLVELVIVLALSTLLKKHIIDNAQLASWLREKVAENLMDQAKEFIDFQRFIPGTRTT